MANLFDTVKVGDLELKHRIVMAPLTRSRAGENLAAARDERRVLPAARFGGADYNRSDARFAAGHRLSVYAGNRDGRTG